MSIDIMFFGMYNKNTYFRVLAVKVLIIRSQYSRVCLSQHVSRCNKCINHTKLPYVRTYSGIQTAVPCQLISRTGCNCVSFKFSQYKEIYLPVLEGDAPEVCCHLLHTSKKYPWDEISLSSKPVRNLHIQMYPA